MRSDPPAQLAVLLAMTGLTQTAAAALLGVAGRSMRRWIEGAQPPPAVVIDRLTALARTLDELADRMVSAIAEGVSEQAVFFGLPPRRRRACLDRTADSRLPPRVWSAAWPNAGQKCNSSAITVGLAAAGLVPGLTASKCGRDGRPRL
jgi:hypothetical protein